MATRLSDGARKEKRVEVTEKLRQLQTAFELDSIELAACLRNPGDTYPSSGLVRTMLIGRQETGKRFTELLDIRLHELEEHCEAGIQALMRTVAPAASFG